MLTLGPLHWFCQLSWAGSMPWARCAEDTGLGWGLVTHVEGMKPHTMTRRGSKASLWGTHGRNESGLSHVPRKGWGSRAYRGRSGCQGKPVGGSGETGL
jgi:hypothetical protein